MKRAESLADRLERSHVDQERRERRDAWRAAGGSSRRALKSFRTDDETAEHRATHNQLVADSIEALASPEGARAFLVSRELNPHLSPGNVAIAAYCAPGRTVGTVAHWRKRGAKVTKGERSGFTLTGPPSRKFWPTAAFIDSQVNAEPLPEAERDRIEGELSPEVAALLSWGIAQALRSRKPSQRLVSEVSKALEAVYAAPAPEEAEDLF